MAPGPDEVLNIRKEFCCHGDHMDFVVMEISWIYLHACVGGNVSLVDRYVMYFKSSKHKRGIYFSEHLIICLQLLWKMKRMILEAKTRRQTVMTA